MRELVFDMVPMQSGGQPEPVGANINTSLSADTQVTLQIRNAQGGVVRTLVNNESRSLGNYQDYWDGRDDNGVIVNDGTYYAVLHYRVNGLVRTVDLTYTTGGARYAFPLSSGCNTRANFAPKIYPFEDDFLELDFTLCSAQEVTMFIGPLWTGGDATRIRTIASRQTFPAGTHTLYWDGLDDDGNIAVAPSGDSLITGAWRYTLPDNALVMTGYKPVIGAITAEPNYFSPFSEKCDAQGRSEGITLNYILSEAVALVELRVYSTETSALVRRLSLQNVPAGANSLFWDGKNNAGEYVDIGDYQAGVMATDAQGNSSMLRYTLVRVDY
jgi:flagellar hook assembly protein FlgD